MGKDLQGDTLKRILLVTAGRSDWGIYQPVITAIKARPNLELTIHDTRSAFTGLAEEVL